jgi:hypothetical protein
MHDYFEGVEESMKTKKPNPDRYREKYTGEMNPYEIDGKGSGSGDGDGYGYGWEEVKS